MTNTWRVFVTACLAASLLAARGAEAQSIPASHRAAMRHDFGRTARPLRSTEAVLPDGRRFAVTLGTATEEGETSYVVAYGPVPERVSTAGRRAPAPSVTTDIVVEASDSETGLVALDARAVVVGHRGAVHLFVELGISNEASVAAHPPCDDEEWTDDESDGESDGGEEDCYESEPELSGTSKLVVFDVATGQMLFEAELSDLGREQSARYRLVDEGDADAGVPTIVIESFDCASVSDEDEGSEPGCAMYVDDASSWDRRLRAEQRAALERATGPVYVEARRYDFDVETGRYAPSAVRSR